MIIDLSVANFRSFRDEQMLSMHVEGMRGGARGRHPSNYALIEDGRLGILRSAAVLGPNASGKSNMLRALAALQWIVVSSAGAKDGQQIPPYEPFRLSTGFEQRPVRLEVEFVIPSGVRYRYEIAFLRNRIVEERLFSFGKRMKALVFDRGPADSWESVKFGGTYRGGTRKFPFFENAAYLSRAGNDASAPDFIQQIYRYFARLTYVPAGTGVMSNIVLNDASMMHAVSELICLADTGVSKVTLEENKDVSNIQLPDNMPEEVKGVILAQNRVSTKFWIKSGSGNLVSFERGDMSNGTTRLMDLLPLILNSFKDGSVFVLDEIDAHLHTDLVNLILKLFHDDEINAKGAQIIFSTHDTNIMNPDLMRRDQIWLTTKKEGLSSLKSLDEYDKKSIRPDSPFGAFYRDGRLGARPWLPYVKVKQALLGTLGGMQG